MSLHVLSTSVIPCTPSHVAQHTDYTCDSQISTVIGAALPSEREQSGWTEGVAIWVAVIIVSLVGEARWPPAHCVVQYQQSRSTVLKVQHDGCPGACKVV